MKKRLFGVGLVIALLSGFLLTASAAEGPYNVDMNTITGELEARSRVAITLVQGKEKTEITGDNNLGYPYLLNINGLSGGVTWVPIRLISETLGAKIDWVVATKDEAAHAIIYTPKDGTVKLFLNATTVTSSGGKTYSEPTYKFPDGTSIPLCLTKAVDSKGGNRIYVPLRFIVTYLLPDAKISWSNAAGFQVTISSDVEETIPNGVKSLTFDKSGDLLLELPNTRAVCNTYGITPTSGDPSSLGLDFIIVKSYGSGIEIHNLDLAGTEEGIDRSFALAEAIVNDTCDTASATEVNKILAMLLKIFKLESDEAYSAAWKTFKAAYCNQELKLGNVYMKIEADLTVSLLPNKDDVQS